MVAEYIEELKVENEELRDGSAVNEVLREQLRLL